MRQKNLLFVFLKFKKTLFYSLAVMLTVSIVFVASNSNPVSARFDESAGTVTVTKNFDLRTSRGGKYADWIPFKSNPAAELASREYFNGQSASAVGFNEGLLIEGTAFNSTITLLDNVYGDFTMIGLPIQEAYTTNASLLADYNRIVLKFTDNEDSSNVFTVALQQDGTTGSHALVAATYAGSTVEWGRYPDHNSAFGSGISITQALWGSGDAKSWYFYFMPETGLFRSSNVQNAAGIDIIANFPTFNGFKDYKAELTFSANHNGAMFSKPDWYDAGETKTAKLLIYELCGQILSGETYTDTAAPMLKVNDLPNGVSGRGYNLINYARSYDIVDGNVNNIQITIKKDGVIQQLNFDNISFIPQSDGEYNVTYKATDNSGKSSTELEKTLIIEPDITPPQMAFTKIYGTKYLKGSQIDIIIPTLTDDIDEEPNLDITVKLGDTVKEQAGGKVLFDEAGEYSIFYTATDAAGNPKTRSFTITVLEKPQTILSFEVGDRVAIPMLESYDEWNIIVQMYPKGVREHSQELLKDALTYAFNAEGEFEIVYKIIYVGQTLPEGEVVTEVKIDKKADNGNNGGDNNNSGNNNGENKPEVKQPSKVRTIIIVSSVAAVALAVGCFVFIRLRRKK